MKTILIIEDNHEVRQSFIDFFEDNSWSVYQATSTEEALELLESTQEVIRISLVDIRLPGKDGNTYIREALQETRDMLFVICTGMPSYQLPLDLFEAARVSKRFYKKPVNDLNILEADLYSLIKSKSV